MYALLFCVVIFSMWMQIYDKKMKNGTFCVGPFVVNVDYLTELSFLEKIFGHFKEMSYLCTRILRKQTIFINFQTVKELWFSTKPFSF